MWKLRCFISFMVLQGPCYSANLALLEFNGNSIDSTYKLLAKVEQYGATARHIFAPNYAIVDLHGIPAQAIQRPSSSYTCYTPADFIQGGLQLENSRIQSAFLHLASQSKGDAKAGAVDPEFFQCKREEGLGGLVVPEQNKLPMTPSPNRFTGKFLAGYVAVGVYLMESAGAQEDWWPAAEERTLNEIVEGLDWLAIQAEQREVKVIWVYAAGSPEKVFTS